jgi:hypothetical protein
MRYTLFWDITQYLEAIFPEISEQPTGTTFKGQEIQFLLIFLYPCIWDREVVPKRRQEISTIDS